MIGTVLKIELCAVCTAVRGNRAPRNSPPAQRREWMLFDAHGSAICPICRSRWSRIGNLPAVGRLSQQ